MLRLHSSPTFSKFCDVYFTKLTPLQEKSALFLDFFSLSPHILPYTYRDSSIWRPFNYLLPRRKPKQYIISNIFYSHSGIKKTIENQLHCSLYLIPNGVNKHISRVSQMTQVDFNLITLANLNYFNARA